MKNKTRLYAVLIALTAALSGCEKISDEGNISDKSIIPEITEEPVSQTDSIYEETVSVTQTAVSFFGTALSSDTEGSVITAAPIVPALTDTSAQEQLISEAVTFAETSVSEKITETAAETSVSGEVTVVTVPTVETKAETVTQQTTSTAAQTEEFSQATEAMKAPSVQSDNFLYPQNNYYALNFPRQKAMWISYLEYDRIMRNADEASFTKSLGECFDNIAALGCNTVYFQVRAHGDAYYSSELYPKGDRLTGDYDPLKIAVRLAHDRGLSIHAWVNPMRLMTDSMMSGVSSSYAVGQWYSDSTKNGTYLVSSGGRYYLNPAYSETVQLICRGISEILSKYDVDGIQIDDYFYPTTDSSFDSAAYAASGTELSLSQWRRENVTRMVRLMYKTVHSTNPTAVFGISPQGNLSNNYNDLYADIYTWTSEAGCCDYICPQIYYGFDNSALPYTQTVDEWKKLIRRGDISLVIGLAAYKSGTEDKYAGQGRTEWENNTDILSRQIDVTDIYGAGYAYFRYDSLFCPDTSVASNVNAELENIRK